MVFADWREPQVNMSFPGGSRKEAKSSFVIEALPVPLPLLRRERGYLSGAFECHPYLGCAVKGRDWTVKMSLAGKS